ncbi:MAG TPA: M56 family metallopeptidase, partial [Bryobacteraceae bacterium]|nr:M56 family metallopeptidase [Bryobacteraceae bacterium]
PVLVTQAVLVTGSAKQSAITLTEVAGFAWMLGSLLLALRLAMKAIQFRRIAAAAKPVEGTCPVRILRSPQVPGPLVTGILHPAILLPEDSATWQPARRRAVLAHELAHIRRRDPAILLVAHAATVIYWFHPLCWLAAARLRMESERACDDAALRIGLRPSGYAGQLLDLARLFNPQPAIPMATTSHLESRVKSILDPFVNRSFAARRTWLAAALITAAIVAPLTVLRLEAQGPGRRGGAPAIQTGGTGTITGAVQDPTGAVVARAQVMISNLQGTNREVVKTDAVGNFALNNIPAGNYSVVAQVPGFTPFRLDVTLTSGGTVMAPVRLSVGDVGEQITVVAAGSPRPTSFAAAPSGKPIRVGGNVQAANLIQQLRPVYPPALQAAGIEGTVLLDAVISKTGEPLSIVPQNTAVDPAFVTAATDAVSQWRYRPTLLNGEPIEVLTTITIDFKLQANTALDLNRSIKSAEFEVARLRETYTEAHPDVRRAEARLEQLRKLQSESQPQPAR